MKPEPKSIFPCNMPLQSPVESTVALLAAIAGGYGCVLYKENYLYYFYPREDQQKHMSHKRLSLYFLSLGGESIESLMKLSDLFSTPNPFIKKSTMEFPLMNHQSNLLLWNLERGRLFGRTDLVIWALHPNFQFETPQPDKPFLLRRYSTGIGMLEATKNFQNNIEKMFQSKPT